MSWKDTQNRNISKLQKKLSSINKRIQRYVEEIVSTNNRTNLYWAQMRRNIGKEYEKLRKVSNEWAKDNIGKIYNSAISDSIAGVKRSSVGRAKLGNVTYGELTRADSTRRNINSILQSFDSNLQIGFAQGEKTINRLISVTQQILVDEAEINKLVAEGIAGPKGSVQKAKLNLQKELSQKALDGKTIAVVDKNGVTRNYNVKSYSELVARTKATEAQSNAAIATAVRVGSDLVQVSSHNTKSEVCQEFEGNIYSLTGDDPDFPELPESPPFHPNCLHTLTVVFREVLEMRGVV